MGSPPTFTIIEAGRPLEVQTRIAGERVLVAASSLRDALGWEVHDGLLCHDAMCLPLPEGSTLEHADGIDLAELALALDRPLVVDLAERAASLGTAVEERVRALRSLQAPDFTLPDLDGRLHSLAEQRGKKVLLVAYASW